MHRGYVKSWRKTKDSGIFNDSPIVFKVSQYCLWCASHKKTNVFGVDLEPGQFITSRKKAAKACKISIKQWRTAANKLQAKHQFLAIKTTNKFTIISIINWHSYQSEEDSTGQDLGQQRASKTAKKGHNQECSNKNYKNKEYMEASPQKTAKKSKGDDINKLTHYFSDLFKSKFNTEYHINHAKDRTLLSKLLNTIPGKSIAEAMRLFFDSDDEFIKRAGFTIGVFNTQINKLTPKIKIVNSELTLIEKAKLKLKDIKECESGY